MKIKLLALASILVSSLSSQTLEHTYSGPAPVSVVNLSSAGHKYMVALGYAVKFYNADHSLWKSVPTLPPVGYPISESVFHASDMLFDTDPDIELMVSYVKFTANPTVSYSSAAVFYDENGKFLTIDQCSQAAVSKVGNEWKLIAAIDSAGKYFKRENWLVYHLPGSLPVAGLTKNNQPGGDVLGDPMPNPSNERVIIPYALPEGSTQGEIAIYDIQGREVKRYTVDRTFNTIVLDNTSLPSGTYLYQLNAGEHHASKKMIIIK